jgi:hypothetical protein
VPKGQPDRLNAEVNTERSMPAPAQRSDQPARATTKVDRRAAASGKDGPVARDQTA